MRWAQKKLVQLQAWQLGTNTPMERKMIEEGRIIQRDDGQYELFSLEAMGGSGEIAKAGDYFKVDAAGCPYPNEKEKFESMHRAIGDGWYEQRSMPVPIWTVDDPACEELCLLLSTGRLQIHPENPKRYFSAKLWGTEETAPRDAVVVFYSVKRDDSGAIQAIDFNFVAKDIFDKTYELLPE